jgi:hypothetical protein
MPSCSRRVIDSLESVVTSVLFDVCVRDAGLCLLLERSLKLLITSNESDVAAFHHRTISTDCQELQVTQRLASYQQFAFQK